MTSTLTFSVNGKPYSLPALPGEKLADLLRKRLHLTGTKVGCGEGRCGTCTVLVDGRPVKSCLLPAERVNGKRVLTIEGLAEMVNGALKLHPLQTAFVSHGAVQCGFCSPGLIMAAFALLQAHPDPSREEIRQALKGNLCRCGGYLAIEAAVLAAAESLRTGEEVTPPELPQSEHAARVIGRSVIRPDAVAKVTCEALFTDDLAFEGMLFARVRRANVPHGILRAVDVSRAKGTAGVGLVLTADDIPGFHTHGLMKSDWPVMVGIGERVRYPGDAVALLAAETQEIADAAIELIEIEIERLPVVNSPIQALEPDAPQLHADGNLLQHIKVRKGDLQVGMTEADVWIEETFSTPIMDHLFLEPECSIAVPGSDGRIEVYVGSQIPYSDRSQVAKVLDLVEDQVRVIGQLVGGGFGGKEDIAGQVHSALLAQASGKPVKLLFDRRESLKVHPKRHATRISVKLGAIGDGRLTAVETTLYGDTGAYASLGNEVMTRATTHSAGAYVIPHTKADCYAMYTNHPPAGAFRGFGALQSAFAIESCMDMLAHQLNMNPFDLRRVNALRVGSKTNTGQLLTDSVGLVACLDQVENQLKALAGSHPFDPVYGDNDDGACVRTWGMAAAFKNTGLGSGAQDCSQAAVALLLDGTIEVRSSAAEIGQGLVTVLQMIAAEEMGITVDQVRVLLMDTDLTPNGGPTTASRQTFVTGNAVRLAAQGLMKRLRDFVAGIMGCSPDQVQQENGFWYRGEQRLSFGEVAVAMQQSGLPLVESYSYTAPTTHPLGEGGDIHFAFSFAAQAVQIELSLTTGRIKVLKVITANDAGQVINPLGYQGQVEGGVMMGIGHALMEEFVIEEGEIITDRMARYPIPTIEDTPEIISLMVEAPANAGPYGAKGVGEIVSMPTPPAIANAVFNAIGLRVTRLPIRKETILSALQET